MQYRKDKYGRELSILGYGCMRFSRSGARGIDIDKAEQEVMAAIKAGVNYLDTAYVYPGNEEAVGEILARNGCREQIYLATKLPHYLIKSMAGLERCFQEQLRRLKTDYIDYYLMHMLTDLPTWEKLKAMGIEEWIQEKKKSGQIRNIGFSYHGHTRAFVELLEAYPWDFCQIQYNYLDEHSQAGRRGLETAERMGIPVTIMEPLRGGKLVEMLPEETKTQMAAHPRHWTPAQWAFHWLWNQTGVTVVLSGMNSMAMVEENVRTAAAARAGELTDEDNRLLESVKTEINRKIKVGCTGCGYCMPCPSGVDIPGIFSCYNAMYTEKKANARREYLRCTAFRKPQSGPSACVKCGKCERHCPQQIPVREKLREAGKALDTPANRLAAWAIRTFRLWG